VELSDPPAPERGVYPRNFSMRDDLEEVTDGGDAGRPGADDDSICTF
jgi:hypothetical protein